MPIPHQCFSSRYNLAQFSIFTTRPMHLYPFVSKPNTPPTSSFIHCFATSPKNPALVQTWRLLILLIHHRNLNYILPRFCLMVGLEFPSWMAKILPTFVDLIHQNFFSYPHSRLLLFVHYLLSLFLSSVLYVYMCSHFKQ